MRSLHGPSVPRSPAQRGAMLALCISVLLALALLSPRPETTEGAWAQSQAATGSAAAMTVPQPRITSCSASSVLINLSLTPRVVVNWTPASGHASTAAVYSLSTSGGLVTIPLGAGATTTGPVGGTYTTTFNAGILGGLLGGQADAGISTLHLSGWTSTPSTVHAVFPLVAGSGTCTITSNG